MERLRSSAEQFAALVEFMERYGDLAKPQHGLQGRVQAERLWDELTVVLNSVGGGVQRTSEKWKKVWADWKTKTKKKGLTIRQHVNRTGGGPSLKLALTPLEERVLAVIGISAVEGPTLVNEHGLESTLQTQADVGCQSNVISIEGPLCKILAWSGWVIPSRLAYSVYVIHMVIIIMLMGSRTTKENLTLIHFVTFYVGVTVISFVLATILYILIEAPCTSLLARTSMMKEFKKKINLKTE